MEADAQPRLKRHWLLVLLALVIAGALAVAVYYFRSSTSLEKSNWPHVVKVGNNCGLIDRTGRYIVNPQYSAINPPTVDGLYPVARGDRWGVMDSAGEIIVDPQFDFAMTLPQNRWVQSSDILIVNDGRWGIADADGIRVPPSHAAPLAFDSDGYAMIVKARGGRRIRGEDDIESVGIIDRSGRVLFSSPNWVSLISAGNGIFAVAERGSHRWRLVDRRGQPIGSATYDVLSGFDREGVAAFRREGKWGFVNSRGEVILEPRFDDVKLGDFRVRLPPFDESGLAAVEVDDQWGFIGKDGSWAITPQFRNVERFNGSDLTVVDAGEGRLGIIDRQGQYVLNPQFSDIGSFRISEMIPVAMEAGQHEQRRWGFVDQAGNVVVEPQYIGFALPGAAGLPIAVNTGQPTLMSQRIGYDEGGRISNFDQASDARWGFIDANGSMVIAPIYEAVTSFDVVGLAGVKQDGKWGFIDRRGQMVIRPQFDELHCFQQPNFDEL